MSPTMKHLIWLGLYIPSICLADDSMAITQQLSHNIYVPQASATPLASDQQPPQAAQNVVQLPSQNLNAVGQSAQAADQGASPQDALNQAMAQAQSTDVSLNNPQPAVVTSEAAPQQPQALSPQAPPTQTVMPSTSVANSNVYTDSEQQAWFNSCLKSVNDARVSKYAQQYCTCGWRHISGGELPLSLLNSGTPVDQAKAGQIMHTITQECMVEVMSGQTQAAS